MNWIYSNFLIKFLVNIKPICVCACVLWMIQSWNHTLKHGKFLTFSPKSVLGSFDSVFLLSRHKAHCIKKNGSCSWNLFYIICTQYFLRPDINWDDLVVRPFRMWMCVYVSYIYPILFKAYVQFISISLIFEESDVRQEMLIKLLSF